MKFCTLLSGSSGNAFYLETAQTKLLIDAGQSGRALTRALEKASGCLPQELDALLLSHEHQDHVCGAGVLARRYQQLAVYATPGTWQEMPAQVGELREEQKYYINEAEVLQIGDLQIEFFPVSHDADQPVGFLFTRGRKKLGIVTDTGVFTSAMAQLLHNVDCLVIEANHDSDLLAKGPYPWFLKKRVASKKGHLSNEQAGLAVAQTLGPQTRHIVLTHLSLENNEPDLALETVGGILEKNDFSLAEMELSVAPRQQPGLYITL